MDLSYDMLTHGVNVVCAQHEDIKGGLTVAWATQVAVDHIMICVGAQSATRDLILASKAFGFSVLTREQIDVARAFGTRSSRDVDKFDRVGYHTAVTGSPLLDDCAATFDCEVQAVYDLQDEKLIVGRIVAAERRRETYEPLIYKEEDY